MMRSIISITFFLVCVSVNAQTTHITKGAIPMGIQVYDYENDRFLDISKLCQGFDTEGMPEDLVIPYRTQIRIFFPEITEKNAADYVAYSNGKRKLSLDNYYLEYEYKGKLVSNPVKESSSAGSTRSFGLVYNPEVVSPGNFLRNTNLEWKVDYEPIDLDVFIQNDEIDERQQFSDSLMNNLFSGNDLFSYDYAYWIENGFTQDLDSEGLPENPRIPIGSGQLVFSTNAPRVELYKDGEITSFNRIEQRPGLQASYYFNPTKSGSYLIRLNDPRKAYGDVSRTYAFSVPFNFWSEGGYFMLGGIGLLGILFLIYRVNTKQKVKSAKLASQISQAELKAVRSQLNPHFLFNALSAVQNLVNQNNNEQANNYIVKLSRLMRQVLSQSEEAFHSLEDELSLSKLYMELEQLRKPFEFELKVDPSIDTNTLVPNMILQPYLENAVLHGINQNGASLLRLVIQENPESILFRIINNGKQKQSSIQEGQGMKLGKQRIHIINQQYGQGKASVNTEIGIEQFTVEIKLPKDL